MLRTLTNTINKISQYSYSTYALAKDIPQSLEHTRINLYQAVNSAIDIALETDKT